MEEQLFVRVRGRVLGPYDQEKLKGLARRGQFSRLHEVSTDGVTWVRASTYPELFTGGEVINIPSESAPVTAPQPETIGVAAESSRLPATTVAPWYYTRDGSQAGPVDFSTLQALAASGRLAAHDLVWNESMPEWASPDQVPGLVLRSESPVSHGRAHRDSRDKDGGGQEAELPTEVAVALLGARPWISFVGCVGLAFAVLTFVGAIFAFITASNARGGKFIFISQGLFGLLYSGLLAIGAVMLLRLAGGIRELGYSRTFQRLHSILEAQRVFWMYIGILLIVLLAFLLVAFIWVFAAVGSMSELQGVQF